MFIGEKSDLTLISVYLQATTNQKSLEIMKMKLEQWAQEYGTVRVGKDNRVVSIKDIYKKMIRGIMKVIGVEEK